MKVHKTDIMKNLLPACVKISITDVPEITVIQNIPDCIFHQQERVSQTLGNKGYISYIITDFDSDLGEPSLLEFYNRYTKE